MVNKDPTKWDLDVIMSLIEGPLLNPKRVEEAFRIAKWGKRLISFFHPLTGRFPTLKKNTVSAIKKTECSAYSYKLFRFNTWLQYNFRYIHMGCSLLTTLISCPDGVKFLREEDPLLRQIADGLHQLDPVSGSFVSACSA